MTYQVTQNDQLQMVDVRYSGCVSVAQRSSEMDETLTILRATGIRRVVTDYELAQLGDDTVVSMSAFATRIATSATLRRCRIAYVGKQGHQFNATIEALAYARGSAFRRFFDRDSAVAWLLAA